MNGQYFRMKQHLGWQPLTEGLRLALLHLCQGAGRSNI